MLFKHVLPLFFLLSLFSTQRLLAQADDETPAALNQKATELGLKPEKGIFDNPILARQVERLNVNGKQILSLYRSQMGGRTHGGALLIPDLNKLPSQPGTINSLRNALPEHNWHTLTLNLDSSELTDQKDIEAAITAGVSFLNDKGIYNIALIAKGVGAAQTIHFLANFAEAESAQLNSIRALILIDATNKIPGSDVDTLSKLIDIPIRVLDAYRSGDYKLREHAKQRKNAKSRQGPDRYLQIALPQPVNYHQRYENQLTKRIRGWMDKHISGFTVEKN